jgi:hypothetical protein
MGLIVFYLFPLILVALAGWLGLETSAFLTGESVVFDNLRAAAISLAIGIPIVAALAVLVPRIESFAPYGDFLRFLWAWVSAAFCVGVLVGLGYVRALRK